MLIRKIPNQQVIPSMWWGFCWYEWQSLRVVIAPIGLNILFAGVRWAYLWVRYSATDWMSRNEPKTRA